MASSANLTCRTELATTFPENSGYVAWVTAAFGPFWGFQVRGRWPLVASCAAETRGAGHAHTAVYKLFPSAFPTALSALSAGLDAWRAGRPLPPERHAKCFSACRSASRALPGLPPLQKGFYAWVSGVIDNAVYPVLFLEYLQVGADVCVCRLAQTELVCWRVALALVVQRRATSEQSPSFPPVAVHAACRIGIPCMQAVLPVLESFWPRL